jgi:predicted MFS family arabinose efflux permease
VSSGYARYVLGLLFVVYVFNFVDRQILAILLEPIKRDLGVSDTAMGFLTGTAFALFYTFAGIPIARLADRGVRRSVIAAARVGVR